MCGLSRLFPRRGEKGDLVPRSAWASRSRGETSRCTLAVQTAPFAGLAAARLGSICSSVERPPGASTGEYARGVDQDEYASERFVERILISLAAQVAAAGPAGIAPEALGALRDLNRYEARTFFGVAGHLVHHDCHPELASLAQMVAEAQRTEATRRSGLLPGDRVRLVGKLPADLVDYNEEWLRQTDFIVRYVGDDKTVDIQPDFQEDYVIETVPVSLLRSVG